MSIISPQVYLHHKVSVWLLKKGSPVFNALMQFMPMKCKCKRLVVHKKGTACNGPTSWFVYNVILHFHTKCGAFIIKCTIVTLCHCTILKTSKIWESIAQNVLRRSTRSFFLPPQIKMENVIWECPYFALYKLPIFLPVIYHYSCFFMYKHHCLQAPDNKHN